MKKRVLSFLFIITLFSLTAVSASAVVNDTLKVGIRWGDTALEAANLENAVGSGYEFGYYDEDREFVYLDETDETTITMQASGSGNGVTVTETRSGEVLFQFRDNGYCLGIRPMGRHTETWCKGYKYPGGFEYRCNADGTLTVINVVDIEDYVKGVVPYEMDKDWPLAALEAQAVCARTYAVKTRHPSLGFDVCAGTDCQVYYGRNRATDMTDAAVDNTAGEMIYYGGKPADTVVYCASNGGATEDAANVWSSIPYLVGKKDPYEAKTNIPNYNWTVTYTADELTWILEQKGYSIGTVKNVCVAEFTPMGNVSKVTFEGSRGSVTVKGETCRTVFYSSTYNKIRQKPAVHHQRSRRSLRRHLYQRQQYGDPLLGRDQRPQRRRKDRQTGRQRIGAVCLRNIYGRRRPNACVFPRTAPLPSPAAAAATISA